MEIIIEYSVSSNRMKNALLKSVRNPAIISDSASD